MKSWIVYMTPDNKIDAVEDLHDGLQQAELTGELNIIMGFPAFKLKRDAIDWITTGMK